MRGGSHDYNNVTYVPLAYATLPPHTHTWPHTTALTHAEQHHLGLPTPPPPPYLAPQHSRVLNNITWEPLLQCKHVGSVDGPPDVAVYREVGPGGGEEV